MNNPTDVTINIADQREWLKEYKASTGLSWAQIGPPMEINPTTLSLFAGDKYNGRNQDLAEKIFRYRQTLQQRAEFKVLAPDIPHFYETKTSNEIMSLLG